MQASLRHAQDAEESGVAAGPEPLPARESASWMAHTSSAQVLLLVSAAMCVGFVFGTATGFLANSTVLVNCLQ